MTVTTPPAAFSDLDAANRYIADLEADMALKPDKYELANQKQLVINLQKVTQKLKMRLAETKADLEGRVQQLESEKADLIDALAQEVEENSTVREAVQEFGLAENPAGPRPKNKAERRGQPEQRPKKKK
jgi:DNA-binding protein H-NS